MGTIQLQTEHSIIHEATKPHNLPSQIPIVRTAPSLRT